MTTNTTTIAKTPRSDYQKARQYLNAQIIDCEHSMAHYKKIQRETSYLDALHTRDALIAKRDELDAEQNKTKESVKSLLEDYRKECGNDKDFPNISVKLDCEDTVGDYLESVGYTAITKEEFETIEKEIDSLTSALKTLVIASQAIALDGLTSPTTESAIKHREAFSRAILKAASFCHF